MSLLTLGAMDEGPPLSATAIAAHLACAHLTQLHRRRLTGELDVHLATDPRREAMEERGLAHEAAYVEQLRDEGRTVHLLADTRDVEATLAAMREGHDVLVQAPLAAAGMRGIADVLLRTDRRSPTGVPIYEPVDTKLTSNTKAGTLLQLCTYAVLLGELQGAEPEQLHVVTPAGHERYRCAEFAAYFRLVRAQLERAQASPPQTYPDPCAHCDVCRFWKHCRDQRVADDHLSQVAGLHATHRRELERQGVTTMAQLADCGGELPEAPERGSEETYKRLGHQAWLQVAARGKQVPPFERLPLEPERGLARLPKPDDGDVFLDFEGDPFVGAHGREYLTGWTWRDGDGWRCEQRWGLTAADERAALVAFLEFVTRMRERHPGMHVYHFGAYEPAALKRLVARYDTHGDVLDELLRGGRLIDLHAVVREAVRAGVDRYGLKQLEPLHGYTRKLQLRDASIACRDLEVALELGRAEQLDDELMQQVADYNREDCESTASLRDWLERLRQAACDDGADIQRPAEADGAPSDKVSARDERIAALKAALVEGLPEPDERDDDERARALLASMLGYFRQEEKNAWWEHFRLRDLPQDEQLDEREMLAELQFVEELPKQGRQKNVRRVFRFAPQETAVKAGDKVHYTAHEDPAEEPKTTKLDVEHIDYGARLVTFSMPAAAAAQPPSAVLTDQVVPAVKLEQSLLAFAEHVRDHGFDDAEPFAAAAELLRRRPPRRGARTGEALRQPNESTLDATRRLCLELEHGVLPIQGPPGAGKTFTGARAIVALAQAGRTVGITAVSHKVIENLLTGIAAAAREADVDLRLVHKDKGEGPAGIEHLNDNGEALAAIGPGAVVGATAWTWSRDDAIGAVDYLFVDEAGQMALAQTLAVARAARNLVLLGDPQQLEQPSRGAHPDGADVAALVHCVGPDRATIADDRGLFLDTTWRLPPPICAFTSELYYDGKLTFQPDCERQRLDGIDLADGADLFLREVSHHGNQASAPEEVAAITAMLREILAKDATWTGRDGKRRALTTDDVMVIAPYNAQVGALRRALEPLGVTAVGTVDKFQGQEAPLVIYSCTSSTAVDAPRGMSFLYDPHRLNVASSRAQGAFVMVASPALFTPEVHSPTEMRMANGMCRFREVAVRLGEG